MKKSKKNPLFKFNKKRDSVFFIFVLGTFVFWFLNKLSKDYNQIINYPVHYTSLSKEFVFQENPPKKIGFRVQASGFYFLSVAFSQEQVNVSVENLKRKNKYDYYLLNDELKKQLRNSIKENITLIDVVTDTLFVKLGKKSFKKVPVVPNLDISYGLGYKSFSGYKILPDSIEISGPEMQVAKINEIKLKPLKLTNLQKPVNTDVEIVKPKIPKVNYATNKVNINIEVEKITEKKMSVPIKIINAPTDKEVVLYPKKIELTCLVRLSQFNQIKASEFVVVCDYSKRTSKHIKPVVVQKSDKVSSVKINVKEIEYLILN